MAKEGNSLLKDATPIIIVGGLAYLAYRSGLFSRVSSGVGEVFEGVGTAAQGAGQGIAEGVEGIGEGIARLFRGAGTAGEGLGYGLGVAGAGTGKAIADTVTNVGDLTDPLGATGRGLANFITAGWSRATDFISGSDSDRAGGSSPNGFLRTIAQWNPFSTVAGVIRSPIAISNWAAAAFAQPNAPSTTRNTNPLVTNTPVVEQMIASSRSSRGRGSSQTLLSTKNNVNPLSQALLNSQASMRASLNRALNTINSRGR